MSNFDSIIMISGISICVVLTIIAIILAIMGGIGGQNDKT